MTAPARLQLTAFAILAVLPLAMAIANKSAPIVLVAAALASLGGRAVAGELDEVRRRLGSALKSPLALACIAYILVAVASLAWSQHSRLTLLGLAELGIAALAPFLLHAALPREVPRPILILAAAFLALGCVSISAELATGLSVRHALGIRAEFFIFKRSVTSILIVYWPLAALLWRSGHRAWPVLLGALLLVATLWSHAAAALLGFGAGLVFLAVALSSRRAAALLAAGTLLAALAVAPYLGDLATRALSERVLDALRDSHARERVAIWQSFGDVVRARPLLGLGFATSAATGDDPVAADVPPGHRLMLAIGHPHNGYLQVRSETGLPGTAAAACLFWLLGLALRHAPRAIAVPGAAMLASTAAVMLVGHGAWQGWWIATIGAGAIWLDRNTAPIGARAQTGGSATGASARPLNPVAST